MIITDRHERRTVAYAASRCNDATLADVAHYEITERGQTTEVWLLVRGESLLVTIAADETVTDKACECRRCDGTGVRDDELCRCEAGETYEARAYVTSIRDDERRHYDHAIYGRTA